jgi:UDP-N-acetylmuramate-alanine ligase
MILKPHLLNSQTKYLSLVLLFSALMNLLLQDIIPLINKKIITYGLTQQADVRAVDIEHNEYKSSYTVLYHGEELGRITINIPGNHNIKNSLSSGLYS